LREPGLEPEAREGDGAGPAALRLVLLDIVIRGPGPDRGLLRVRAGSLPYPDKNAGRAAARAHVLL